MSNLKDLMDKPDTIKLSNDMSMDIYSVTLEDEATFFDLQMAEKYMQAITFLVKQTITRAFPGATEEEINGLNKKDLQVITEAVLKKNKLEVKPDSAKN
ncbi:MAG: hypothetical protein ACTSYA_09350 [Candidatus Kariarchaeaceae archaeon]